MSRDAKADYRAILDHLKHIKAKHAERGTGDTRDTREMADATGMSLASVRRRLHQLRDMDCVEAYSGEGCGLGVIYWEYKKDLP